MSHKLNKTSTEWKIINMSIKSGKHVTKLTVLHDENTQGSSQELPKHNKGQK